MPRRNESEDDERSRKRKKRRDSDGSVSDDGSAMSHRPRSDDDEEGSRGRRKKRHRKESKKSKKSSKKQKSSSSNRRKHKHRKKVSGRRRHEDRYSDDSDLSDDSSRDSYRDRKRRRKGEKKRKRQNRDAPEEDVQDQTSSHNHILTQALCRLFSERPVFAEELPILLIRLAGGSTFDLGQMNDHVASNHLSAVLRCLEEYGVQQKDGQWVFEAPPGRQDERVLLRAIRSVLNDVGVTMEAVTSYERNPQPLELAPSKAPLEAKEDSKPSLEDSQLERIKELTSSLVLKYKAKDAELGTQLAGLCQTIAQGENISIDGLPDEGLKTALEELFRTCGLEQSEMADDQSDEDDDEESDHEPLMGFGLPEEGEQGDVLQLRLAAVMEACRNPKPRVLGPQRPTQEEAATKYGSDEEDEGPNLPGQGPHRLRGPALPDHLLRAQAEHRALELKATAAGIEVPFQGGGREEWMVVPGKYDFLSNIKAGQPIKSRGFQNKKTRGGEENGQARPLHPAIQAEMDAIQKAHQEFRGPSLIEQHRAKKLEEKREAAGKKEEWQWSRDKDLDAGRRVDKDALHMVLGGAADNLKTKFHGGFH